MAKKLKPTEFEEMPEVGELFEIEALDRTGLMIRSDGTYIRILEVTPPNPNLLSIEESQEVAATYAAMLGRLRPKQSLQFIVDSRPVRVADVLADSRREVQMVAGKLTEDGPVSEMDPLDLSRWRLYAAMEESVKMNSTDQGAVDMRAYVVVPYTPINEGNKASVREMLPFVKDEKKANGFVERDVSAHERGVRESLSHIEAIRADIESLGITAKLLNGEQVAEHLWSRFNPTQADSPHSSVAALRGEVLTEIEGNDSQEKAARAAHTLREALCRSSFDFETSSKWGEIDRDIVQTVYASTTAENTAFGWVMAPMLTQACFTMSVHVEALDRRKERTRLKRDHRKTFAINRNAEAKQKVPDFDRYTKEAEIEQALNQMAGQQRANVYRVSVYQTLRVRGPEPDLDMLSESVDFVVNQMETAIDCRVMRGEHEQLNLWRSTLPFGKDYGQAKRRYFSNNAADMIPLVGTACGSPTGIPLAFSEPTRTLVRLNPYDRTHANQTGVIAGKSGAGKTVTANMIISRCIAHGAQGDVIDRAGHYATLVDLVAGAQAINLGAEDSDFAINPWDVEDVRKVGKEKIAFLIGLHAVMMGKEGLNMMERGKLGEAIRGVYARCAAGQETADGKPMIPREAELLNELDRMADVSESSGAVEAASVIRTLLGRLGEFAGDGSYAYLLDRETTVPKDSPLCVYDTRAVPADVINPVTFAITEFVKGRIEKRRAEGQALAAQENAPMFAGKSLLFIDETWHLLESPDTGTYLNDLARRSRHLGLFLVVSSQQLSDFAGEHGRALLQNSTMQFLLGQLPNEVPFIQEALNLTDQEAELLKQLQTVKGQYSEMFWRNGTRGRGKVSVRIGPLEYWGFTSDPLRDVPKRNAMIEEMGGPEHTWAAIHRLARETPMTSSAGAAA